VKLFSGCAENSTSDREGGALGEPALPISDVGRARAPSRAALIFGIATADRFSLQTERGVEHWENVGQKTIMQNARLKIANAPCSWGVLEFDLPGQALGCAQVLNEIKETGYAGTELGDWGFMPTDPAALKAELQARQLDLVGAFVQAAFSDEKAHAKGEERALKTAKLMVQAVGSHPFIVLADDNATVPTRTQLAGRIQAEHSLRSDQWQVFGKGVNRVAAAVRRETGLRTVFHHHSAGYVETPWEVEAMLNATDPGLVGLCFDTGHFRFGGGDPVRALRQYRSRIWHVHFKDCDPRVHEQSREKKWDYFESMKHGIFCELGKGDVNFAAVAAELERTQYSGWIVVEQDVLPGTGEPKEYARRNREFLKGIGL
jgi:inosose dehydratase